MSDMRRIMMMFPRPTNEGGGGDDPTPSVTIDGYVGFLSDYDDTRTSNKYIAATGAEANYNGWDISGYVEIPEDAHYVYFANSTNAQANFNTTYTGVYNSSKTFMQHIAIGAALPSGAKYLRISDTTAKVDAGFIVLLKEGRT